MPNFRHEVLNAIVRARRSVRNYRASRTNCAAIVAITLTGCAVTALVTYLLTRGQFTDHAENQLRVADANFQEAQEEIDAILYQRVVLPRLGNEQSSWVDRDLLRRGIAYYERYIRENRERVANADSILEAYRWLGTLFDIAGQFDDAAVAFSNEAAFIAMMLENPAPARDEDSRHDLSNRQLSAHLKAAYSLHYARRVDEAIELLEALRWKTEGLIDDTPGEPGYRQSLANVLYELSVLKKLEGEEDMAEEFGKRSYEIASALAAQYPQRMDFRATQIAAGVLRRTRLTNSENKEELATSFAELVANLDTLCASDDKTACEHHLRDLASRAISIQQYDDAELFMQRCQKILEPLLARSSTRASLQSHAARIYHELGGIALLQKQPKKARALFAKAVYWQTSACRLSPQDVAYWNLLASHRRGLGQAAWLENARDKDAPKRGSLRPFAAPWGATRFCYGNRSLPSGPFNGFPSPVANVNGGGPK